MPHAVKLAALLSIAPVIALAACGASVPEARAPLVPRVELAIRLPDRAWTGARIPVVLELTNRGEHDVPIEAARARIEVRPRVEPVDGCGAVPEWITIDAGADVLAPDESLRLATETPCALRAPGEYELWVDLAIGPPADDDERAPRPTDDVLAVSSTITVEERHG